MLMTGRSTLRRLDVGKRNFSLVLASFSLCLAASISWPAMNCLAQSTPVDVSDAKADGKRQLIIHVDDAGMCHAANVATIRGLESGVVTSTSVMLNCGWAPEFAAYARQHPEYCYGVHFTLNSEWGGYRWGPVAGRDRVPSLVDPSGYLWGDVASFAKHAKAEEVELELRAQIALAKKLEIPLSHLDTHMGAVLARPDIVDIYVKLGLEEDLPILWLRRMESPERATYPYLAGVLESVVDKFDRQKLPVLDSIIQLYDGNDLEKRKQRYLEAISNLKPGINQLIIHSSMESPELSAITTSHTRRNQDFELFSSPETLEHIKQQGIELTSWKQLTERLREKL
jgi:chitin disaccharide deacetylase